MFKVLITDLQTRIRYHGTLRTGDQLHITQGKSVEIALDNKPGYGFRIGKIRGWLASDSNLIYYLFDAYGKRYQMRIIPSMVA